MKLIQKSLFKGTQELELLDNEVRIHIKSAFKEKNKSVPLEILNPEPVIEGSMLHFHSRVKCGPLISLYLNKPNELEFSSFVDALKKKALNEYQIFAGLKN